MEYFPYSPRPFQEGIVSFISDSVSSGRSAVLESGTGTGKTICALAGTLPFAKSTERKVVFLTRTKSQQKQVISELREISKKWDVFGIAVQGRSLNTCPMMSENKEFRSGTPEEMSKLCSQLKKDGGAKCPYFRRLLETDTDEFIITLREKMPDPETFQSMCISEGICPYEMAKIAMKYADVVTAPYTFIVMPNIRRRLLDWLDVAIEDLIIIVDEAHNMPDFLRDSCTYEYTLNALNSAEKEAGTVFDPEVSAGVSVTDVTGIIRNCFADAEIEFLRGEDGTIPYGFIREQMMDDLSKPSTALDGIFKNLIELGESIREEKKMNLKLPRSYIGSLGSFLQFWDTCEEGCYVRLINGGENPSFEAYCMDPYMAAEPFRECFASVHMSGTLEPLEHYTDELGLDECDICTFSSPFNPDNLFTLYADDVTTRHKDIQIDPDNIERIKDYIIEIVNNMGRNTAVFFPSYEMMERFVSTGILDRIESSVLMERRDMSQGELMETVDVFKKSTSAVLFAVTGGRVSEGIDFPSKDLEVAVIVGLPYPRPSFKKEALIRYSDLRFGNGWDHVIRSPMIRKMRQARGRLIRSEDDIGVAIILDSRITQIYGFGAVRSDNLVKDAEDFFDGLLIPSEAFVRRSESF